MMLFMPTIYLFFKENGMDIQDIMVLQAIYSVTVALIEIPSGYVADVLGRKNSMIVGTTFGFLGIIIYAFSFGFWSFLPAALCLGIGQSFVSGSDTALMYDSLKQLNREKDFIKLEGRTISMGNFAEAVAFIIGGFLADFTLRTPFYFQIGIAFLGVFIAFLLVEPQVEKLKDGRTKPWKNMKKIIRFSLKEHTLLRYYILYSAVIGATTLAMAWFAQPYFQTIGIKDGIYYGIIGAGLNFAVAFTAFYAHQIERAFKTRVILILILIVLIGCYIWASQWVGYWSLIALVIFYFTRGIATPILRDYMNRETPSEMRATVMSIRSFIIRLIFASISPFLGYFADVYSVEQALLLTGILFFVLGGIVLIFLLKSTRN
jgi:MFS family permease